MMYIVARRVRSASPRATATTIPATAPLESRPLSDVEGPLKAWLLELSATVTVGHEGVDEKAIVPNEEVD